MRQQALSPSSRWVVAKDRCRAAGNPGEALVGGPPACGIQPWFTAFEHLPSVLLSLAFLVSLLLLAPVQVAAAELLQVRGATQLQVGDRNRSYQVDLACIQVEPSDRAAATTWLKRELPRGTKLNIRPLQAEGEELSARVIRLDKGQDLGEALIQAGLAQADPCG